MKTTATLNGNSNDACCMYIYTEGVARKYDNRPTSKDLNLMDRLSYSIGC